MTIVFPSFSKASSLVGHEYHLELTMGSRALRLQQVVFKHTLQNEPLFSVAGTNIGPLPNAITTIMPDTEGVFTVTDAYFQESNLGGIWNLAVFDTAQEYFEDDQVKLNIGDMDAASIPELALYRGLPTHVDFVMEGDFLSTKYGEKEIKLVFSKVAKARPNEKPDEPNVALIGYKGTFSTALNAYHHLSQVGSSKPLRRLPLVIATSVAQANDPDGAESHMRELNGYLIENRLMNHDRLLRTKMMEAAPFHIIAFDANLEKSTPEVWEHIYEMGFKLPIINT